jgi:hypothetical protein
MKLSKKSDFLLNFFISQRGASKMTAKTKKIIYRLYQDLCNAYDFLDSFKKKTYPYEIKQIEHTSEIIMPKKFNNNSFPPEIRKTIELNSNYQVKFELNIFNRNIIIYFILEEFNDKDIKKLMEYLDLIIMWLYILHEYSSLKCAETLVVYFYFTSLEKKLPDTNLEILNENHVNTAFTTTCPQDSEIIVFRQEEWFKVFLHETFHNFGLDFSNMDTINCTKEILSIFKVESDVNLYEAYAEFWAEIMNIIFCSFLMIEKKEDYDTFIKYIEFLLSYEISFSFFQMVKILKFMGLKYSDLYSVSQLSSHVRRNFYKEDTSVLSYFIIKTILLNSYGDFLVWCDTHNLSLIPFKKTNSNMNEFCSFIKKKYKSKSMLERISQTESLLQKTSDPFIQNNLRMSIYELS